MTVLWVLLGILGALILLLVTLLTFGKANVRIVCRDDVHMTLRIAFVRIPLYRGKKKPTQSLSECTDPKKALRDEINRRKKAEKEQKKALRKQKRKEKRKARKEAKRQKSGGSQGGILKDLTLADKLRTVKSLLRILYRSTNGRITLHIKRLHLVVATNDAAKTALLYGALTASVSGLLYWLDQHYMKLEYEENSVSSRADFSSERTTFDLDISASLHLRNALRLLKNLLPVYLQARKTARGNRLKRTPADQNKKNA